MQFKLPYLLVGDTVGALDGLKVGTLVGLPIHRERTFNDSFKIYADEIFTDLYSLVGFNDGLTDGIMVGVPVIKWNYML